IASVEEGPLPGRSAEEIDLGGKFLLPGIIDPHVHLRDMGESEKEDFTTGTACAAVGGVTTVMQMPNGIPDVLTPEDFLERKALIENRTYADIALYAWACDQNRKELHHFQELGAIGYKIFTAVTGAFKEDFANYITVDIDKLFLLFEEIAGFDGQIGIHAESNPILELFTERCKETMKPDIDAWRLSRPNFAEDLAVFDALTLSTATGARLHICHVIGAEAVQLIRNAKKKNAKITSEVAPCNLLLCDKDLHAVGSWGKFSPAMLSAKGSWTGPSTRWEPTTPPRSTSSRTTKIYGSLRPADPASKFFCLRC
ncbi:MAG: amidohydrolase family protein, partial [Nitrospinae bacterium]|nr:amidohydrolase family protein [Nitrospinota bacterium]